MRPLEEKLPKAAKVVIDVLAVIAVAVWILIVLDWTGVITAPWRTQTPAPRGEKLPEPYNIQVKWDPPVHSGFFITEAFGKLSFSTSRGIRSEKELEYVLRMAIKKALEEHDVSLTGWMLSVSINGGESEFLVIGVNEFIASLDEYLREAMGILRDHDPELYELLSDQGFVKECLRKRFRIMVIRVLGDGSRDASYHQACRY